MYPTVTAVLYREGIMKKIVSVLLVCAMAAFSLTACSFTQEKNRETIYQVALLQSLTQGYYDWEDEPTTLYRHYVKVELLKP